MKVTYDAEVDVLRILFSSAPVEEGDIVGLEILDASRRVENPRSVEYAVAT